MNKHLKDERDISCGVVSIPEPGGLYEGPGSVNPAGSGVLTGAPQSRPEPTTGSV